MWWYLVENQAASRDCEEAAAWRRLPISSVITSMEILLIKLYSYIDIFPSIILLKMAKICTCKSWGVIITTDDYFLVLRMKPLPCGLMSGENWQNLSSSLPNIRPSGRSNCMGENKSQSISQSFSRGFGDRAQANKNGWPVRNSPLQGGLTKRFYFFDTCNL